MINLNAKITSFDTVFSYDLQQFPEINTDNYVIDKVVSINGNFETNIVNTSTFSLKPNKYTDFEETINVILRYSNNLDITDKRIIEFKINVEGAKKTFIIRNDGDTDANLTIVHASAATDLTYYYRIDDNDIGFEFIEESLTGKSEVSKSYTIPVGKSFYIYANRWNINYILSNTSSNEKYFNRFSNVSSNIKFEGDLRNINGGDICSFCYLFYNCQDMTEAPELNFSYSYVSYTIYQSMFDGCINLKKAPSILPLTTLYKYGYCKMFRNCKSLTTAPIIEATSITGYSMYSMFEGCTSLINAPEIKVTNFKSDNTSEPQYQMAYMFKGCTSLVNPPSLLPCTQLYRQCYASMFQGCTSLIKTPKFYSTTQPDRYSFQFMFSGCTSLTTISDLPSNLYVQLCAWSMFECCTSLTEINISSTTSTGHAEQYFECMFKNCTGLTKATITIPQLNGAVQMFKGCTNLSYIKLDCNSYSKNTEITNGVAANGTFLKRADVDIPTGVDGIPEGWTVITLT